LRLGRYGHRHNYVVFAYSKTHHGAAGNPTGLI
jgi:hypothetical protein